MMTQKLKTMRDLSNENYIVGFRADSGKITMLSYPLDIKQVEKEDEVSITYEGNEYRLSQDTEFFEIVMPKGVNIITRSRVIAMGD